MKNNEKTIRGVFSDDYEELELKGDISSDKKK